MHCCNKNRYTFGIIIGSIYTLASLIIFSLTVYSCVDGSRQQVDGMYELKYPIKAMVSSLVTAVVSALFIFAIIKKRHSLILPWLILCILALAGTCLFILVALFASALFNASNDDYFALLLIGAGSIGIEIAIFWFSCWLYRDIRKHNIEKLASPVVSYQSGDNNYTMMSEKPLL